MPEQANPTEMISLITTCSNRLHHLQQTLPLMLQQSNTEVIVVDYGCKQGTAAWVGEHHPAACVVEVRDDSDFCAARARNMGAKAATGALFFFADADIAIRDDLGAWAERSVREGHYYRYPSRYGRSFTGTFICHESDFRRSTGYDEAFRLWGGRISTCTNASVSWA